MSKLSEGFYQQGDVLQIATDLLGKYLVTEIGGQRTAGYIVETEAYRGPDDRGSHAYLDKRTPRNEMMFAAGGVVYMYICYGIHDMLNIVTGPLNSSHAVLIRAVEPVEGLDIMRQRRNLFADDTRLCRGPGALAKALGLNKEHNGHSLSENTVWIEDHNNIPGRIAAGPRIGMNFDGPYRDIPWRFYVPGNPNVSRPNK